MLLSTRCQPPCLATRLTYRRGDATLCLLQGGADHVFSVGAGGCVPAAVLQRVQQM